MGFRNHQNVYQLHDLRGREIAASVTQENKNEEN